MENALLCMLGFFLINMLIYARADERTDGLYGVFSVKEGGTYSCRAKIENNLKSGSKELYILETVSGTASVTLQHNWPEIFRGETVTLRCEIQGGGGTQWTYEWSPNWLNYPVTSSEHRINTAAGSDGAYYQCLGRSDRQLTAWSDAFRLTVLQFRGETVTLRCEIQGGGGTQWTYEWNLNWLNYPVTSSEHRITAAAGSDAPAYKPRASLTAKDKIIPAGGSVALSCSVDIGDGWKFDLIRQESPQLIKSNEPRGVFSVSEGGVYSCRGGRGDPVFYTETSIKVTIHETVSIKPTVTLQPNWSQIFRGETVTLRCEIQGGGGTQWTYEWRPTSRNSPTSTANKPRASLTAKDKIRPAGGSVALSCSVDIGDGWKFDLIRQESPQLIKSNEPRGVFSVSEGGVYSCRGGRGDPVFYTETSIKVTIHETGELVPVLSVSPSWLSPGTSVTLSCEVEPQSAGWRFFWYKAVPESSVRYYRHELLPGNSSRTEQNYTVHGPTLTAGYVCRAGRGEPVNYTDYSEAKFVWSADPHPAASLSVSPDRVQHFSSDSVSLSCEGNSAGWRVRRFPETDLLSNCSTWGRMNGPTCTININRSGSGVYWCESGSGEFSNAINITVQDAFSAPILVSPVHPVTEGDPVTLSCRDEEQKLLSNVFFYHNDKLLHDDSRGELKISAVSKSDEGFYKCEHSGKESPQSWMAVRVAVSSPVSSLVLLIIGPVLGMILIVLLLLLWRRRRSKDLSSIRVNQSESSNPASATNLGVTQTDSSLYSSLLHGDISLYETIQPSRASGDAKRPPHPAEDSDYANVQPGKRIPAATDAAVGQREERKDPKTEKRDPVPPVNGNVERTDGLYGVFSVKEGGTYSCRAKNENNLKSESKELYILETVSSTASVTLQHNWPEIFRGETVTLRCEIQGGGGTQWTYEWNLNWLNYPVTSSEHRITAAAGSDGAEYRCFGRSGHQLTAWSDAFRLTVLPYKPRASLTAKDKIIPAGGSVALSCSVDIGDGWKFDLIRHWLIKSNEPDGVFSVSEGGVYSCRGGRGDPVFYTETSSEVFIQKTVSIKPTVTLQPNWSQIFRGETVTLRCEIQGGGGTQWTYEWRPTSRNSPTSSEYRITAADSSRYKCRGSGNYQLTQWSDDLSLTVAANKPRVSLTAKDKIIPAGGSVALSCSVDIGDGWKFDLIRQESPQLIKSNEPRGVFSVSEGGVYSCRGGRGDPVFYTETSIKVTIHETAANKPRASLTAKDKIRPAGGSVALSCSVDIGDGWKFDLIRQESPQLIKSNEPDGVFSVSEGGVYSCRGGRGDPVFYTETSIKVSIHETGELVPVLSVSPSWLSPGTSVTLSCEVEPQSAGWRFFWYKAVPESSVRYYRHELLPGNSSRTEQNYTVHGPTLTAGYVCRAGRGEPVNYTDYSEAKFVWSADPHPAASLSVSPDRVQHFSSDSVSLSCEGNSAGWRVRRFQTDLLSNCSTWGRMNGPTCTININRSGSGVYWCESGSGEFSNAINITVQDAFSAPILVSPVHPVTEGDPVTLSCRDEEQKLLSNVFFYHNDKLLHDDSRGELKISAVSKSDEGFYKCEHSGKESPQSWMAVRVAVSSPVSSLVLLIIGPVLGIILIVLLLLLWRRRRSKALCCIRSKVLQSSSQSSTTNQAEHHDYRSLFHGNADLYETVGSAETAGNADEPRDITYTDIDLKTFGKERRLHGPDDGPVYSEVKTGAADSTPTYAVIYLKKKGKKKRKGKSSPPAADAAVYSEIRSAPALGNNAAM
ncbi:LOW QUALITY PROTEIN: uncharacterized protein FYW61_019641 [Anableps anableps]